VSTVGREGTESPELPAVERLTSPSDTARFEDLTGEGRRGRVARGTLINSAFLLGLNLLALIRGFAVAGFVEVEDYGVWVSWSSALRRCTAWP
jgi:hypothetical protein